MQTPGITDEQQEYGHVKTNAINAESCDRLLCHHVVAIIVSPVTSLTFLVSLMLNLSGYCDVE